MTILFPSGYINKNQVDEDFQKEYEAAIGQGIKVLLFHQELWDFKRKVVFVEKYKMENGKNIQIGEDIQHAETRSEKVVYRGWMMKPEEYECFYAGLLEKGITLLTSPTEYKRMHVFRESYPLIAEDTPKTMFFENWKEIDFREINDNFSKFMVKDFVKSVKGTDFPKFFTTPVQQDFSERLEQFVKYRGELFTGGIQLKEYLDLAYYGDKTNEYRVFYMSGNVISVSRNSNQPMYTKELPKGLAEKYSALPSPFYAVDFIECGDGQFKIIETGDGGVSGLSPGQEEEGFYRRLKLAGNGV